MLPSLFSMCSIYLAYSGSDELNPLTISHTARIISCAAIGSAKNSIDSGLKPNIRKGAVANHNQPPIRPRTANHRGVSFVLYKK